jgi:hypothetical protein
MDEYIFDSDDNIFSDDLSARILNNRALYNAYSRLISLEIIPMIRNAVNGGRAQGHGAIYLGQLGLDDFLTKAILLKLKVEFLLQVRSSSFCNSFVIYY